MKSLVSMIVVVAASLLPANILALSLVTTGRKRMRTHHSSKTPSSSSSSASTKILMESATIERTSTANDNCSSSDLSPFLREIVDEQRGLQMNVGKAMDVLMNDYPYLLRRVPDYSIYHNAISLKASNGQVQLSKLSSYKTAIGITRTMLSLLYDTDRSVVQSRTVYDSPRTQIRISFNAMLVPKLATSSMGGRTVYVDGICVYTLNLSPVLREDEHGNVSRNEGAGKIVEHRIEKLVVNGAPLQSPYFNAFSALDMVSVRGAGALVGAGAGAWS